MNVLAVFAHPDDETMLAGGLLAYLAKTGFRLSYLICTRGEGGETGQPALCSQDQLGTVREAELRNAVKNLGGNQLKILDFVDPLVGEDNQLFSFTSDTPALSAMITEEIIQQDIQIVISHGSNGEYGHPGHLTVYQAVEQAVLKISSPVYWYTIQANHPNPIKPYLVNKNDPASWLFNAEAVKSEKLAAINAHETQHALFKRRKNKEFGREVSLEEILVLEEAYCLKNTNGSDPVLTHLNQFGVIKKMP